jgi:hypothetical protein
MLINLIVYPQHTLQTMAAQNLIFSDTGPQSFKSDHHSKLTFCSLNFFDVHML